ncbi:hypothetical protein EMIHUDRAFT_237837 [Emiliania huxleyi CCMP1516]|uniref:NUDIX hydrolase n=2 Tax=Emiliania huxleyi TaxID=2903 RepID=A0A0D3JP75_EMIH1|nr:hypothetical protein EMIHUDRAFT_237837 [Emiliania huxleyi CCMP1516]EOD25310.1 hypothetical protein EMIHUDRAFT_237837 [Emiliania huxleyi CCMP1516]|eukprot:XP_005777739.1 hypothetical protein EMIHUDRAFT_237837 [Emiliania huxleyi CCMP1516]
MLWSYICLAYYESVFCIHLRPIGNETYRINLWVDIEVSLHFAGGHNVVEGDRVSWMNVDKALLAHPAWLPRYPQERDGFKLGAISAYPLQATSSIPLPEPPERAFSVSQHREHFRVYHLPVVWQVHHDGSGWVLDEFS